MGGRDRTGLVAIAALTAAGVTAEAIADDYALAAERAHTRDPALEEFLAERGTSARELVTDLASTLDYDRPLLRARLVVERAPEVEASQRPVRAPGARDPL